jgi:hypothetical protein
MHRRAAILPLRLSRRASARASNSLRSCCLSVVLQLLHFGSPLIPLKLANSRRLDRQTAHLESATAIKQVILNAANNRSLFARPERFELPTLRFEA